MKQRILLVEDDRALRLLLCRHLRGDGFEVTEARDGTNALTRLGDTYFRHGEFDLLISDIRMPGHTGLDLATELRRADWPTPILLITAFGSAAVHESAQRLGAAILDKPLDLDDLTVAVRRLLAA